ncbi:non-receptor serine/threonine protein kinase [Lithospermum erythrorhizon]|uniref:Wee1-like protein kinase n=1 Tax=Lithospermum erythrorhizon TaxID=34254 RepID=A0AAV3R7S4_LITER
MKRKSQTESSFTKKKLNNHKNEVKGSLINPFTFQLGEISLTNQQSTPRFQSVLDSVEAQSELGIIPPPPTFDEILSQDFFCTPDYITPDAAAIAYNFHKDNIPCPKSPEKDKAATKRQRLVLEEDICGREEWDNDTASEKRNGYVSQSAVALRCRVMPPPCIMNPYLNKSSDIDGDTFGNRRSKHEGVQPETIGGVGLSRYRADFHEIERIGNGNFSCVFKALKRIDGCLYAVKRSLKKLQKDTERRKALMEVQAMAALGSHQNIVRYYTSWFEDDHLYIQMELCDCNVSMSQSYKPCTEDEVLEALHQIAKALQHMHERGIAHLDVKPDNIYVREGAYKLGDFGCSSLLDSSLPIEEGDARYMPQEILNEKYDHLEKVDIFSLGVTIYEFVRGSAFPESGTNFMVLREGKMHLLPGHSMPFQNLLKVMMDPDPVRRPSAKDIIASEAVRGISGVAPHRDIRSVSTMRAMDCLEMNSIDRMLPT